MTTATRASDPKATMAVPMHLALRREPRGPIVGRYPLVEADLADARAELWLRHYLRKGMPTAPLEEAACEVLPIPDRAQPERLKGYGLVTRDGGGTIRDTLAFTAESLRPAALRAAQGLIDAGIIEKGGAYWADLAPGEIDAQVEEEPRPAGRFQVTAKPAPMACLELAIDGLLEEATAVGEESADHYPVFYTEEAYTQAEAFSRRGGSINPPAESGAVLIGPLCTCPKTGEFYGVVCSVLEVQEAQQQTQFSLLYSGKSWQVIQSHVRALQSRPSTRAFRVLGQAHGHPFLPHRDTKSCDQCPDQGTCELTSVFVSPEDVTWSKAVFARQPWQLCHIFGLDARSRPVHGLFGQRNGTLARRGFHIVPEFKAEHVHSTQGTVEARSDHGD